MRNRGLFIVSAILAVGMLGCSTAQLQKAQSDAQAVHDATTRPSVVAIADATSPVTGGLSTYLLSAVGTAATIAMGGIGLFLKSSIKGVQTAVEDHTAAVTSTAASPVIGPAPPNSTVNPPIIKM